MVVSEVGAEAPQEEETVEPPAAVEAHLEEEEEAVEEG